MTRMMKKNILQTTLLLLLGMITWSCSESDNDTSAKQMRLFKDGVEISELEFSLGAASKMVRVGAPFPTTLDSLMATVFNTSRYLWRRTPGVSHELQS